jgi:beta-lactamase class A
MTAPAAVLHKPGPSCGKGTEDAAAAPLGSAFQALRTRRARLAVASGTLRWNQPLTLTAQLTSLPSGELQDEPDGTQVSGKTPPPR